MCFFLKKILDATEQFHPICVQFLNWTRERNLAILSTGRLKIYASMRKYTRLVFLSASNSSIQKRRQGHYLLLASSSYTELEIVPLTREREYEAGRLWFPFSLFISHKMLHFIFFIFTIKIKNQAYGLQNERMK
jgi:hypothetical protein